MTEGTDPFALTVADIVAASRLYMLNGLKRPGLWIAWLCLWLGFVVALALIYGVDLVVAQAPILLAISVLPILALVLLAWVWGPLSARRSFRRQKSLHEPMAYGWTATALHIDSSYGAFDMPWSHFIHWAEDDRSFLLFESDRLYRIVPKRVLTPDQQASLRRALAAIGA